jgi:hypothetical protein
MTIHALDPEVEKRLRGKARKENKSLNQAIKEILAQGVGKPGSGTVDRQGDFAEFSGIWSAEDDASFQNAIIDLEKADSEDWK